MKRKKTVPAEVVPKPVNDAAPVPEKDHPLYDRLFVVGFAVLLFFAMTVQTVPMSLILAAVALALSFGRGGYARFRGRLGIPVLGFLAFLILCGAAACIRASAPTLTENMPSCWRPEPWACCCWHADGNRTPADSCSASLPCAE